MLRRGSIVRAYLPSTLVMDICRSGRWLGLVASARTGTCASACPKEAGDAFLPDFPPSQFLRSFQFYLDWICLAAPGFWDDYIEPRIVRQTMTFAMTELNLWTVLSSPLALLKTVITYVLPGPPLFDEQDHFAPHPSPGFEGYYSRTLLEDGSTLAIIFCWVNNAKSCGNMVTVSYHPVDASGIPEFQRVFFVDRIDVEVEQFSPNRPLSFVLHAPGFGTMEVAPRSMQYSLSVPDAQLELTLSLIKPVSWSHSRPLEGPMGPFTHLSHLLPLNWTVHSTASDAQLTLTYSGQTLTGHGVTHMEKNWGTSFPSGWIWSQSFATGAGARSLSLAGGIALPGVHAYLVGYRSAKCSWDFRPPFTVAVGPLSPFISVAHDSRAGVVELVLRTFTRKLIVRLDAPMDSFASFPAPLKEGHRMGYAFESFNARTWVEAWTRRWPWERWRLVEEGFCGQNEDGRPCSALEFGGAFCHLLMDERQDEW